MAIHKLDENSIDKKIMADIRGISSSSDIPSKSTTEAPKKHVEKVISGSAKTRKEGILAKKETDNVASEIVKPILGRALSDMVVTAMSTVSDIIIDAVDVKLYGERRHSRRGTGLTNYSYSTIGRSSLSSLTSTLGSTRNYNALSPAKSGGVASFRIDPIVLEERGDAELVIDSMREMIDMYGVASVADLYDLVGLRTAAIDFKYGWDNFSSAGIRRTIDGYLLEYPKPKPIE